MENVTALAKETKKKQFLIDLYNEVLEDKLKLELEIHDWNLAVWMERASLGNCFVASE